MKVVEAPKIEFRCDACGARCEGEPSEFIPRNTMPPTWIARCAFCACESIVSPTALLAVAVGERLGGARAYPGDVQPVAATPKRLR